MAAPGMVLCTVLAEVSHRKLSSRLRVSLVWLRFCKVATSASSLSWLAAAELAAASLALSSGVRTLQGTRRACVLILLSHHLQVLKKDVGKAIDILGDILLNSKLEESAIVRERDVILREMEEVWLNCWAMF